MAVLTVPNLANVLPASFTAPGLTEGEFLALCENYPDATLEYTAEGTVIIMPPTDPETGRHANLVVFQLTAWSLEQGQGFVLGPESGFRFRDGSRRSPDATWCNEARWQEARKFGELFPVFAPEFVIEIRSRQQSARALREKMEEYISNGVQLGWLIDPIERTVAIYRPGSAPEVLTNPSRVVGEGPVAGFVLNLGRVL